MSERISATVTPPANAVIEADVATALAEDIGSGDATASLLDDAPDCAYLLCKEDCVVAGRLWFDACHRALDPDVRIDWHCEEGDRLTKGTVAATLIGHNRSLVTAERASLNFLQTLSGTATATAAYVDAVSGTGTRILDTRKTIPGLRFAQKYAVRVGGGMNHRIGLYDAMMLKENHIRAFGSVTAAIERARRQHPDLPLIVEVETLDQLREALATGCTRVLVDDFDAETRREAVRIAHAAPFNGAIPLEVSGGVNLETVRTIAEDGVDCISIGALTKHVHAIDFSLKLGAPPAP